MKLKELIEIEGLESISEKTNISIYNLNSLANRDFKELNRVKALGFIQILKREYDIDISDLESDVRDYFEDKNSINNDEEPILVSPNKLKPKKSLSKWIILLFVIAGLLYFYNSNKLDELLSSNKEETLSNIENLNSTANISADIAKKNVIIKKDKNNTTEIEIKTIATKNNSNIIDINGTKSIKVMADIPRGKHSKKNTNGTIIVNADAGVEEPSENTPTPDANATEIKTITINPTRGILWFGFIDIKKRKHKEFMTKKSTPFDLKGKKWLLTTGHGYLDIVSDVKTLELADRKRHYFYIDSKEIKEITKKEFRRLNHGRNW